MKSLSSVVKHLVQTGSDMIFDIWKNLHSGGIIFATKDQI